tara:strand:+ start:608 stop:835 length:228 start_codon:yes stop_codon:yes gene_type:complete
MKAFFDYLKALAVKMVINQLKENTDKFAKMIADKADIPLLGEKAEKELAEKLIGFVVELLESLNINDSPKKGSSL